MHHADADPQRTAPARPKMPVAYIPHGGGPWPFVNLGFSSRAEDDGLRAYLAGLSQITPERPRALLIVSAHWEEPVATVMTAPRPPMLFDYYGFPAESYALSWPAPGSPEVAARVRGALTAAGIASAEDHARGYDHGTFIPMMLSYPEASIPTVQLSLKAGLDPAAHIALGRALAPLRHEGIFIVGSGMSYHNMRGFGSRGREASETFDAWLRETVAMAPTEREARLVAWASAPAARASHPREEHLLPLMVVAGAAVDDPGHTPYSASYAGVRISAHHFG
ncbi:MAG: dioxygenase [Myxococcales bacterium]|nr:dioxygenase [Myxococcales bacterium]